MTTKSNMPYIAAGSLVRCLQCPGALHLLSNRSGVECHRCGATHVFGTFPVLTGLYWGRRRDAAKAEEAA